ncbi:MAG: hypothetical protein WD556_07200 [Actinomycetota bacterium]
MAVAFSRLELSTASYIWGLIDPDDQLVGQCLTAGQTFGNLLTMADSLGKVRIDNVKVLGAHHEWIRQARDVATERNDVFHSHWIFHSDDPSTPVRTRYKRSKDGFVEWSDVPFDQANLPQLRDRIEALIFGLRSIKERVPEMFRSGKIRRTKWTDDESTEGKADQPVDS